MKRLKIQQKTEEKQKRFIHGCFIILLLLFATPKAFSSENLQSRINLNFKNVPLEKVIDHIELTTGYRFLYQDDDLELQRNVSINYQGNIRGALDILFRDSNIETLVSNKQIILKTKPKKEPFLQISGTVSDEGGEPLPGATVLVNEMERGTSTDENGKYTIKAHKGDLISFVFIGFKDLDKVVGNKTTINVILKEDFNELGEVVIGYESMKKSKVSGAISSVGGETIKQNVQLGATFDKGLDGLMKGVFITQGSGELGKNADINIRGITSPFSGGNNNPLFVIDGVALFINSNTEGDKVNGTNFNPLETINPEDIESIDVLKDAAATAIYGSRGANGVIIVKTKSGHYNQPTAVSVSYQASFGRPIKTLDYLKTSEFKEYILALNKNSYEYYLTHLKTDTEYGDQNLGSLEQFGFRFDEATKKYTYDPAKVKFGNATTDWNDVVYRKPAVAHNANISLTGGGEKSFYNFTLGYVNQEGLLKADKLERYNSRLSYNFNITKNLKAGALINFSRSFTESGFSTANTKTGNNNLGSNILKFRPDLPPYGKNGKLTYDNAGTDDFPTYKINPLGLTTLSNQNSMLNHSFLGNAFAELNITPSFSVKVQYSMQLSFGDSRSFQPKEYSIMGYEKSTQSELLTSNFLSSNTTVDYTAKYTKEIGNHSLTGLIGFSHSEEKDDTKIYSYKGFINSEVGTQPQDAKHVESRLRTVLPSALNSVFGRVSYNYLNKYGLLASLRLDRSSKFALENRNAWFPAVSGYWNVNKERFMENSAFEELKLRASYGFTGSTNLGAFEYKQFYEAGRDKYNDKPTLAPTEDLANEKIRWEKTQEVNLGIDFTLKNYTLYGNLDLYYKKTTDVIANATVIMESGYSSFSSNYASLSNKGIELSLGSDIISTDDWEWKVNLNAAKNVNKILSLNNGIKNTGLDDFYIVGRESNIVRGFIADGIIQDQKTIDDLNKKAQSKKHAFYYAKSTGPGDYLYRDISGPKGVPDGKVDDYDRTVIGTRQPDLFGGFNTSLRYKNFNVGVYFSYSLGIDSFRASEDSQFAKFNNVERHMAPQNRWSPTNKTASLPRLIHLQGGAGTQGNNRESTATLFDASYLRLTSINLSYNLPLRIVERLGLQSLKFYASASNLYTWTNFPGLDPQGALGGVASGMNDANYDAYPASKTFSVGVKIQY